MTGVQTCALPILIKSIQSSGKVLQKAHLMVNRPHRTAVKMNKIKKGQGFENEIRAPLKNNPLGIKGSS